MFDEIQDQGTYHIEIKDGELDGQTFEVGPGGLTIGRSLDCDVSIGDRSISRRHVRFLLDDGYCYAEDMGSHNGFLVNGERTHRQCLRDSDVVDLGYCKLIFHSSGSWRERETAGEIVEEVQELEEDARTPRQIIKAPLHPYALMAPLFAVLAFWFWAFALGAVVLAALTALEIKRKARHRGMALAGAAVVLALAAIASNLWLTGGDVAGASAKRCRGNLERIAGALERYAEQNEGRYPKSLEDLYPNYMRKKERLLCPGTGPGEEAGRGYLFPAAGQERLPAEAVLVCDDSLENHGGEGGFVLRADGEVEWMPRDEMLVLLGDLKGR